MICTPEFIWGQQGAEAYKRGATGEGQNFWESKRTRVRCEECGESMNTSSLRHHMERAHGGLLPQVRGVVVGRGGLEVYKVSFTWIINSVDSPVEGCPAKEKTSGRLREHFMWRNVDMAARCGEIEFNLDWEEGDDKVENVPTFRYLGQHLDQTYGDWSAVRQNIMRATSV